MIRPFSVSDVRSARFQNPGMVLVIGIYPSKVYLDSIVRSTAVLSLDRKHGCIGRPVGGWLDELLSYEV